MLKYILVLFITQPILRSKIARNNTCNSFGDYYHPDSNDNCFYNPDNTLSVPELVEKYAGVVETHKVVSHDGYVLSLFRIPRRNPKGVILLHHSIATSSRIYLWQGNSSLALTLWREGYDVWLANQRVTFWSSGHVNMTPSEWRYWDFDFHEMGLYDVSAEVELIREVTGKRKIVYIGHSLGSTIGLIYSSLKPEEAQNALERMILIAPACYFDFMRGAGNVFRYLRTLVVVLTDWLPLGSALLFLPVMTQVAPIALRLFPFFLYVTSLLVSVFCGCTPEETNPTFYNFDTTMYLDNFSWKMLAHYQQLLTVNHRFQYYDYGETENLRVYSAKNPPLYPVEKISVPTLVISGPDDTLISLKDSEALYEELSPQAQDGFWNMIGLNHFDYLIGKHRRDIFNGRLIDYLNHRQSF